MAEQPGLHRVSDLVIHPALLRKIAVYLASGDTGNVVLAVRRGRITGLAIESNWQADELVSRYTVETSESTHQV